MKYYGCGKIGHIKRNCRQQQQQPQQRLQRTMQITEEDFNQYLQRSDTPTIPPACLSEDPSDEDFMKTPIYTTGSVDSDSNLDSSIDKEMPRIMFKMKKYYTICVWNERSMDFDMPETAAKNTIIYGVFNKKKWEQEAKKCSYRYLNQISENWKDKVQLEQLIIQKKEDLKYI